MSLIYIYSSELKHKRDFVLCHLKANFVWSFEKILNMSVWLLKVVNQQKQLDDWCTQKKSSEGEQTEKETDKEEDSLDVDNTKTVEVYIC